jgi:hypothetical protein
MLSSLRSLFRRPKSNIQYLSSISSTVTDSPSWTSLSGRFGADFAPHDYDPAQVQDLYQDALTALDRAEVVIIRGASYRAQGRTRLLEEAQPALKQPQQITRFAHNALVKWCIVAEDRWRGVAEYLWSIYVCILTPDLLVEHTT